MDVHESTPLFATDELDGADHDANDAVLTVSRTLLQRLEHELSEVERAVNRLEEGTYGRCDICGTEVDPLRLAENPTLHRCSTHLESSTADW